MKKILIITSSRGKTVPWSEREVYVRDFCKNLQRRLKNTKVVYATYSDLIFWVYNQKPSILDNHNGYRLEEYDFVQFRNFCYDLDTAPVVANYLNHFGIPFTNSEVNNGINTEKLSQMFTLAFANLPVPNTYYAHIVDQDFQKTIGDKLGYPMIMKANDGSKGDSNYLVDSQAELQEILDRESGKYFVFQNYIPNNGDYRLLFIGLNREPLVFLRQGDKDTHLNNTSKGGQGKLVDVKQLPLVFRQHALSAARTLGREISGVDILVDKTTDKPYLLEVNSTPAIATGFAQDKKLAAFSGYLNELLDGKEEE